MGFWGVVKRMLQGKPAFEAPPETDSWDDDKPTIDYAEERQAKRAATDRNNLFDEKGYKQPPVVELTHVQDTLNHELYELWVTIMNRSERTVRLDKVTLLGTKYALNYPLAPHAEHAFRVYRGEVVRRDEYKKAELYYCDEASGDYFRADHLVQYKYTMDGVYEIVGFELCQPIRDV
jgi:hypothetical protein